MQEIGDIEGADEWVALDVFRIVERKETQIQRPTIQP